MTSQVYYRKWRPGCFADLVGQEHVATTLRQAIRQGRVSHSYLFCGPRGTGKTTTARILAKAVNCLDPQDGDPCNQCSVCVSFNEERFMDTIEMDAASNRGIEDIREIRDKVNFAPVEGRRKVYIIDEAHMLTDQASNAFLKTLEEPPAHVIFILCTTEANRILPTIVSRCQRFDFRRLPSERIYQRLAEITEGEGVAVAPDALRLVARYAAGSLRDAENLLEQLVVSYGDGVTLAQVEELLGLGHSDRWLDLVKYLLMGNTTASLELINQAAWDGVDLRQMHRQALELLRAAMLLEWNAADALELPEHVTAQLKELSNLPSQLENSEGPAHLGRSKHALRCPIHPAAGTSGGGNLQRRHCSSRPGRCPGTRGTAGDVTAAAPPAGRCSPSPRRHDRCRSRRAAARDANQSRPAERPAARPAEGPRTAPVRPQPAAPPEVPAGAVGGDNDVSSMWQATVKALGRATGKRYNLGALLRDCKPNTITIEGDTLLIPFVHPSQSGTNAGGTGRPQRQESGDRGRNALLRFILRGQDNPGGGV